MSPAGIHHAEFTGVTTPPNAVEVELLFVPVFEDEGTPLDLTSLDDATGGEVSRARASGEFRAKPYDVFVTPVVRGWKAKRIGLIGAGKSTDWDPERMRRVAAASSYAAHERAVSSLGWLVRGSAPAVHVARMAADGLSASEFGIGTYRRRTERKRADRVVVVAPGAPDGEVADAVRIGR